MLNLSLSTVQAVEELRASSTRHYLVFAFSVVVFTLATALLVTVGALAFQSPLADYENALRILFAAGGFIVAVMLLWGFWHGHRILSDARAHWTAWQNAERDAKYPEIDVTPLAPTPLLALPASEIETMRVTLPNRVGEDMPKQLVRGFDWRDVEFLCRLLENKFKFTEEAMEKLTLPHSFEVMGKAQDGTGYTRWMAWCVKAGIIVGRDGKKSGTLAVFAVGEMLKRLNETKDETL